jgi:hypothetical protein
MEATLILRSANKVNTSDTHGNFFVKVPAHMLVDGPFEVQLVSACIILSGTDAPVSVHCNFGSPALLYDSANSGSSDCVAVLKTVTETVPGAPVIRCSSAGMPDLIRVQIRNVQTMAVRTDVDHATLVLSVKQADSAMKSVKNSRMF